MSAQRIVIASRESALAMWQANTVQRLLHDCWPDHDFVL